jgi:hypothetical protein
VEIRLRSISRAIAPAWKEMFALAQPVAYRVLSVHERAFNLITARGDIVGIVWPELGNGPFHAVLSRPMDCETTARALVSGKALVDAGEATIWEAKLTAVGRALPPSAVKRALIPVRSRWERSNPSPGRQNDGVNGRIHKLLDRHPAVPPLLAGLQEGNRAAIRAGVLALAGLGSGLTPAGDDFLVGLMAGIWIFPEALHSSLTVLAACRLIVEAAAPRTTTLSAAWLRHAGKGEFGEPWHRLVQGLAAEDSQQIHRAVRRIIDTGATSGEDAWAGFCAWIEG